MEFKVKNGDADKQRVGCVVAGIFDKRKLSAAAKQLGHTPSHVSKKIARLEARL
ncbi:MAG: LysR family transcriptional regulator, partial [Gammaproteobacteria bacterium]|nr:LysR family transcriptional regulator [Gammaproteobacteria bacterium]